MNDTRILLEFGRTDQEAIIPGIASLGLKIEWVPGGYKSAIAPTHITLDAYKIGKDEPETLHELDDFSGLSILLIDIANRHKGIGEHHDDEPLLEPKGSSSITHNHSTYHFTLDENYQWVADLVYGYVKGLEATRKARTIAGNLGKFTVVHYNTGQAYGGPEEGGWWYNWGNEEQRFTYDTLEEAKAQLAWLEGEISLCEEARLYQPDEVVITGWPDRKPQYS